MAKEDIYNFGPSDDFINSQAESGQKTYEKQRYGRPQFGFPDISQDQVDRSRLLNVLMGAGGGIRAAEGAGSPLAALAMGLGGGIQTGQAAQAQQQAAQLQRRQLEAQAAEEQLNQTPVGQISPGLAKSLQAKYGMDISDIPMGQFQKFSGLLQHSQDLENKLALLQAGGEQKKATAKAGSATKEESRLRAQLQTLTKDYRTVRDSYNTVLSVGSKPSAAGDLSLIFAYMKILDPGSTVREGEQATAEQARGVPASILAQYNKILKGEKLAPEQRADFIAQAANLYQAKTETTNATRQEYRELAERLGANPENVDVGFTVSERDRQSRGGGMVQMIAPNGEPFQVSAANVDAAIKRGARRK